MCVARASNQPIESILIVRLSSIGDVVRVIPALHSLRMAHPRAHIAWATCAPAARLLEGHPALDELLVWDPPGATAAKMASLLRFCRTIRQRRFEVAIDFHGTRWECGAIVASSGARTRYGFPRWNCRECTHWFTNTKVEISFPQPNRIEQFLALCAPLCDTRTTEAHIAVPPRVAASVDHFVAEKLAGRPFAVLHPPVCEPLKRWPYGMFARLADLLAGKTTMQVVLTWGPGQFDVVEQVVARTSLPVVLGPEPTDLMAYAWLVKKAQLYVGPDTGPMHIASAMGTPVVALFGGSKPERHGPFRPPHRLLYYPWLHGIDPGTCALGPDNGLHLIEPEVVFGACMNLVGPGTGPPSQAWQAERHENGVGRGTDELSSPACPIVRVPGESGDAHFGGGDG